MTIMIFIGLFLLSVLLTAFSHFFIYIVDKTITTSSKDTGHILTNILRFLIMAPILEECGFRLWLKRGKYYFALSIICASTLLLYTIIYSNYTSGIYIFKTLILVVLLLTIIASKYKPRLFLKHYTSFYYISILIFGFGHLTNYNDIEFFSPMLMPLLALPYIVSGFILTRTRLTYGFSYGILLHAAFNALPLILITISMKH